jgi:tetratricopeptide (TPR) repeat protein
MKVSRKTVFLWAMIIVSLTLIAYVPAMRAGYIWDDDINVTNNRTLRTSDGLRKIWFEPGAEKLPYYPLVHTTFWLEYQLWELHPFGYHLVNVLLHATNSILLLFILSYLNVPGAWLAAALFALHPVHVESVAWITERKNVLSALFYLSSLLAYLRFAELDRDVVDAHEPDKMRSLASARSSHRWRLYLLSLLLFFCALLSKTVTCSLPAAILLILWWKRDRITRGDVLALLPFFALGIVLALTTIWVEIYLIGAQGEAWNLSFLDRWLLAGRVLWFYAAKLIWPHRLTFIYPRWQIDPGIWWQFLFPLAAAAVIVILWSLKGRIGKGPLVAVLYFAGTMVPTLGFFNVYGMRFSFVADHWQYLPSIGLITLASAGIGAVLGRLGSRKRQIGFALCLCLLILFGTKVWRQSQIYQNAETVYRDTLAKNPNAWMAHNNLGELLHERGDLKTAMYHYSEALRIKPNYMMARLNMAEVLADQGRIEEAFPYGLEALRLRPDLPELHNSLAMIYAEQNKTDQAIYHLSQALKIRPDYAEAQANLGTILVSQGEYTEAMASFSRALAIAPEYAPAHNNMGVVLVKQGKLDEAVSHYSKALEIDPDYAKAHNNMGDALARKGKLDEAVGHLYQALQLEPDLVDAHVNLGTVFFRQARFQEAISHYRRVLQLKPESPEVHNNLGVALTHQGKFEEAISHFTRALQLKPDYVEAQRNLTVVSQQTGRRAQSPGNP